MKNNNKKINLLFFLEGNADIRFIKGLSERFSLVLMGPKDNLIKSGLLDRIREEKLIFDIKLIEGGRIAFQVRSFLELLKIKNIDVILAQEVLRGALNANIVSFIRKIPCINHTGISPVEYFSFRYIKKEINYFKFLIGKVTISLLMMLNGVLSSLWIVVGPYLPKVAKNYTDKYVVGKIYGVNTSFFKPVTSDEKMIIRESLSIPKDKFIILLSSRISHEKDPETVLRSIELLYKEGLPVYLVNLAGSHQKLVDLAKKLNIYEYEKWLDARGAVHPMYELAKYYQASDVVLQASLAEGCGISPLEGLSCGLPVVATNIGGMSAQLKGRCFLFEPMNYKQVTEYFREIINNYKEYQNLALAQREWVIDMWDHVSAHDQLVDQVEALLENRIKSSDKLIKS